MTLRKIYLFSAVVFAALVITAIVRASTAEAEVNCARAEVLKDSQSQQPVPLPKSVIGALGVMAYVITEVRSGSAAEQAGLQPGDIVTHLEEQIASIQDFQGKIANSEPGTFFKIKYRRFNRSTGALEEHTGTIQTKAFQASVPPQNGYSRLPVLPRPALTGVAISALALSYQSALTLEILRGSNASAQLGSAL